MYEPHPMRQDRRGFTLMELMTVVVIIAILAAITVPNINLGRIRLNGAMQAVGTTLLACQREAVARQYNVIVMFDVTGRALRILYDNNNNNVQDGGERIKVIPLESEAVFGRAGATPRAFGSNPVNFTRTVNGFPAVIFYRSGSLSEAGGFYLTSVKAAAGVTKNLSDTRAIELIRATGRAEWYRYNSGGGTWNRGF